MLSRNWRDGSSFQEWDCSRAAIRMLAFPFSCGITRLHCWYSSDANAGALHLKATIDPDEDRGQCLGGDGIGERSAVDAPRARRIRQVDHDRARVFVVSEHEHVAIDAFAGFELG